MSSFFIRLISLVQNTLAEVTASVRPNEVISLFLWNLIKTIFSYWLSTTFFPNSMFIEVECWIWSHVSWSVSSLRLILVLGCHNCWVYISPKYSVNHVPLVYTIYVQPAGFLLDLRLWHDINSTGLYCILILGYSLPRWIWLFLILNIFTNLRAMF